MYINLPLTVVYIGRTLRNYCYNQINTCQLMNPYETEEKKQINKRHIRFVEVLASTYVQMA